MALVHCLAYPGTQGRWGGKAPSSGGYAAHCVGTMQGKESGIQVLAGLAPSSQTIGSLFSVIYEQVKRNSWMAEAKKAPVSWQQSWVS